MHRIRTAAVLAGGIGRIGQRQDRHPALLSKQVYSTFTGPNGQALPPNAPPALGDRIAFANDDYAGNHKHHSQRPVASEHIDCVVISPTTAICDASVAVGGAMLFADNWTLNMATQGPPAAVKLTGGTNQYRHARGTVRLKAAGKSGNNSDETIQFTT